MPESEVSEPMSEASEIEDTSATSEDSAPEIDWSVISLGRKRAEREYGTNDTSAEVKGSRKVWIAVWHYLSWNNIPPVSLLKDFVVSIEKDLYSSDRSYIIEMLRRFFEYFTGTRYLDINKVKFSYDEWCSGDDSVRSEIESSLRNIIDILSKWDMLHEYPAEVASQILFDLTQLKSIMRVIRMARSRCRLFELHSVKLAVSAVIRMRRKRTPMIDPQCTQKAQKLRYYFNLLEDIQYKMNELVCKATSHIIDNNILPTSSLRNREEEFSVIKNTIYTCKADCTGEIDPQLLTTKILLAISWIGLWTKVHHTSTLSYLFIRASNHVCLCSESIIESDVFAVLDSCTHLMCVACASTTLRTPAEFRTCPVCRIQTSHWMRSDTFVQLKTLLKKRKDEFPQGSRMLALAEWQGVLARDEIPTLDSGEEDFDDQDFLLPDSSEEDSSYDSGEQDSGNMDVLPAIDSENP